MIRETVEARGHFNITAKHPTTFQITKDTDISRRADCIIGVAADKAMHDLGERTKTALINDDSVVNLTLNVGEMQEVVTGYGSSRLTCSSNVDMVARKSSFTSHRTLMIKADKAAINLDRRLIERLKRLEDILIIVEVDV